MQKPSQGRIVLFYPFNGRDTRAAVITKVHSDTCVNLQVFWDAGDGRPDPYVTSVDLAKELDGVVQPVARNWVWPPRV